LVFAIIKNYISVDFNNQAEYFLNMNK